MFMLLAVAGGGARPTFTAFMSSTLLAKYRYRRRLPHLQRADCDLFVTFCTGARMPLPGGARDLVLGHCLREHENRIRLYAAVVMPDHVQLLLSPKRDLDGWPFPLVDILQCMKSATAHCINKVFNLPGPVWEEESFDHVLRSDESLEEKCEYIRQNPVRRGLVRRAEEYPWLWVDPDLWSCGAGASAREKANSR
jgi:REP element-mobilizing transposase RayT